VAGGWAASGSLTVKAAGQASNPARPREAYGHADLAAGGRRQELAERQEVSICPFFEPLAANNELFADVAEMRHGTAERSQAKAEEDEKDFRHA